MNGTIHLVRHGQVENPKGVIYGRLPGFHLSERGQRQAEAAADHLADRDIGTIWASPLERVQETAEAIAKRHGLEITTDARLIESGTTLEGVGRTIGAFVTNPTTWWRLRNPWRPSWGETFAEIRARVLETIHDAAAAADGREVVIVTHQTPVLVARLTFEGRNIPPWMGRVRCSTGSVTSVAVTDDRATSVEYFVPQV